jgi:hypothetical protein
VHFATPRQLIAIALAWALVLVAYDEHANPRPLARYWEEFLGGSTRPTVNEASGSAAGDKPRLRLSMPHLCCTDCLNEVRSALKGFSWLGPGRPANPPPDPDAATADAANGDEIDFDIWDLESADFVPLAAALAGAGLVPDKIEVSGIGHYRLDVALPHLCGGASARTAGEPLERLLRKETQGRWLDSTAVNEADKTLVVYARMNAVVDIAELTTALGHAGFSASSIRILTGPEM